MGGNIEQKEHLGASAIDVVMDQRDKLRKKCFTPLEEPRAGQGLAGFGRSQ